MSHPDGLSLQSKVSLLQSVDLSCLGQQELTVAAFQMAAHGVRREVHVPVQRELTHGGAVALALADIGVLNRDEWLEEWQRETGLIGLEIQLKCTNTRQARLATILAAEKDPRQRAMMLLLLLQHREKVELELTAQTLCEVDLSLYEGEEIFMMLAGVGGVIELALQGVHIEAEAVFRKAEELLLVRAVSTGVGVLTV